VPLVARILPRLARGELACREQDPAGATFCRRLAKEDGVLDFHAPAPALSARINGLFPWPGCSIDLGGHQVRLGLADAIEADIKPRPDSVPGTVLGADADGLLVATGGGVLRLRRLQRPGGRMLAAADFLRGFPVGAGTLVPSHEMPALLR
jgi:methionyl-tRNA formyltransferase